MKTIYLFAPANYASGGVEAMHQLADALRQHGHDARIAYVPAGTTTQVHPAYAAYDIVLGDPVDSDDCLVVVPESMFGMAERFTKARVLIWWLSIDFYYGKTRESAIEDALRRAMSFLRGRWRPVRSLGRFAHAAQSDYADGYLRRRGLKPAVLSDYLNDALVTPFEEAPRRFQVLYNPIKGFKRTRRIIAALPEIDFVALEGYDRTQLTALLRSSAVYIDFGHHPGKDRMPREAAVNGCVVITNRRNGARSQIDLPIPDRYKIDDTRRDFPSRVAALVRQVRLDPEAARAEFAPYVAHVRNQKRVFIEEAGRLLSSIASG